jgi:nitrile hydratase accessory protein
VSADSAALAAGLHGTAAPPRRNGELVFDEPWQSRAFGIAVGLHDAGVFGWEEFRVRLVARIGARDAGEGDDGGGAYYEDWLGALEDVLAGNDVVGPEELGRRAAAVADARAHDHGR